MRAGSARHRWGWKRWVMIGVAAAALAIVAGPFVYIHFIEGKAPPPLTLSSPSASTDPTGKADASKASATADGTWKVASGSLVGYRVKELLFGQSNVAAGRTGSVTGSITIRGTTVTAGRFTVDMTTVASDESRRDDQFNGRIMETATYPTSTFTLAEPIELGSIPVDGVQRTFKAKGRLMLHGVTKLVSFDVTIERTGSTFQVAGSIPITFADWNIPNPSFGPVSTEDHGVLEFRLNFARA
jgi:polyisoprenoid-binding protein YceI